MRHLLTVNEGESFQDLLENGQCLGFVHARELILNHLGEGCGSSSVSRFDHVSYSFHLVCLPELLRKHLSFDELEHEINLARCVYYVVEFHNILMALDSFEGQDLLNDTLLALQILQH